jgi:hypothetical protein
MNPVDARSLHFLCCLANPAFISSSIDVMEQSIFVISCGNPAVPLPRTAASFLFAAVRGLHVQQY